MEFEPDLVPATLLKRYKRFLADVRLHDGTELTVHCPNTGAMTGCAEPGWPVWLSVSDSKTRKYPHSWELVDTGQGMACIHSARANAVVAEAVEAGRIEKLNGYGSLRREVKYGQGSRADLLLADEDRQCFVEIKAVTLLRDKGLGVFPDAVSERARKHLRALQCEVAADRRAVIFFCVFHQGIVSVAPACDIDPAYCEALEEALAAGVEAMAWSATVTPQGLSLQREIPFQFK